MEKESFNKDAGLRVKKCRQILGLTQKGLADKLNDLGFSVSQIGISRYETGTVTIPAGVFLAVKELAGI